MKLSHIISYLSAFACLVPLMAFPDKLPSLGGMSSLAYELNSRDFKTNSIALSGAVGFEILQEVIPAKWCYATSYETDEGLQQFIAQNICEVSNDEIIESAQEIIQIATNSPLFSKYKKWQDLHFEPFDLDEEIELSKVDKALADRFNEASQELANRYGENTPEYRKQRLNLEFWCIILAKHNNFRFERAPIYFSMVGFYY